MLSSVKVDKLYFGLGTVTKEVIDKVDEVIVKYYGEIIKSGNPERYNKLYRSVTPTKQLRPNYNGFNHNLQMIPLNQFSMFLNELKDVLGRDLDIYELHLAKDILTKEEVISYLEMLLDHEYMNGYIASRTEANSFNTVYVAKKKNLSSNRKQRLKIKFYDKGNELICRNGINRVLPLKEPINIPDLPMGYSTGKDRYGLLLYKMNLLRCELELRENRLPYTTIGEIIEGIENGTFQDSIDNYYNEILSTTVFSEPKKKTSGKTLKELAIQSVLESDIDFKTLFVNAGMRRQYNYFKKDKEFIARENDHLFEELREKLIY